METNLIIDPTELDLIREVMDRFNKSIWTTKDGHEIHVSKMTSIHIFHAVILLKTRLNSIKVHNPAITDVSFHQDWIVKLMEELQSRNTKKSKSLYVLLLLGNT